MIYPLNNNSTVKIARNQTIVQLLRPLQAYLNRPDVTEVTINRPGEIWVKTYHGWQSYLIPKLSFSYLQSLTTALIAFNGLPLSSISSVILPDGQRGQIVLPPTCVEGTLSISIRKHSMIVKSVDELWQDGAFNDYDVVHINQSPSKPPNQRPVEKKLTQDIGLNQLSLIDQSLIKLKEARDIRNFLEQAVLSKRNIVIAGRTGSGKTTFARSLINKVPTQERVITIEDVHELFLPHHPNRVHLLYGTGQGRVTAAECLASCMRQSPDRIFLAELRGGEAWDYLNSLNTGHPGAITTTHANSALQTFERMITLIKKSNIGQGIDIEVIRRVLYATVDIILYFENFKLKEIFYDPLFSKSKML